MAERVEGFRGQGAGIGAGVAFIGPMRFINTKYKTTSRQAIHLISNAPA